MPKFTEANIAAIFGHEAAEDESPERLRDYYFKSAVFDQVTAPLPLRVLVGHKGVGKSALFQIAMREDIEAHRLPVFIQPDDVRTIATGNEDFLSLIAQWKEGLRDIVVKKALSAVAPADGKMATVINAGGGLVSSLIDLFKPLLEDKANVTAISRGVLSNFFEKKEILVYMDDLDRGWTGNRSDMVRISALINAVRDISRENPGIHFRISLRSDVYFLVRTSDQSTDKIGGSVIWFNWTNHQILAMLVKRLCAFEGRETDETALMALKQSQLASYLNPILEERFGGNGKWANAPMYRVIMSLIRRRPRDLVKLMTLAARRAAEAGASRIGTDHLRNVFAEYSADRIQDAANEYRSELPDVQRLLFGMKANKKERESRTGFLYKTDDLLKKITSIEQGGLFKDAFGTKVDTRALAAFLYKINFLIASKDRPDGYIDRKYFEENRYLSSSFVDFGYNWEVHPAYRWALQPDSVDDIYRAVGLTADDN